jgi:hypothetical protein
LTVRTPVTIDDGTNDVASLAVTHFTWIRSVNYLLPVPVDPPVLLALYHHHTHKQNRSLFPIILIITFRKNHFIPYLNLNHEI